jgi:hypothetical protein
MPEYNCIFWVEKNSTFSKSTTREGDILPAREARARKCWDVGVSLYPEMDKREAGLGIGVKPASLDDGFIWGYGGSVVLMAIISH